MGLVACSGPSPSSGGSGSCALTADLHGRTYTSLGGVHRIPRYVRSVGTATVPGCEGEAPFEIRAFSVEGTNPAVAFASPAYEENVFVRDGVDSIPGAVRRVLDPPACESNGASIELHGPWLGILGADGKTELDLVPPYDLSMRVDEATPTRYERTLLTVRVQAGEPLTREDVRSSLWKGGEIDIHAACSNGRFVVESVTASPPGSPPS
jgi:hypothetical protein